MNITSERLEKAMAFLAETDSEYAERVGQVMPTDFMCDVAEALAFKTAEGSSVEARKQEAKCSEEVKKAKEQHFQAVVERERLKAQRQRAVILIECWRSLEASRRVGNIQ
jgi:hypothetical protein